MALILFDIDGILIHPIPNRYDAKIREELIRELFPGSVPKDIYTQGKTHWQILVEQLEQIGVTDPEHDSRFLPALKRQNELYAQKHPDGIERIAGVDRLIARLVSDQYTIGVLTGNVKEAARVKLQAVGFWNYFPIGAFGDQSRERHKLVEIARQDALAKTGKRFVNNEIILIGDTIRDIECAQKAGVGIIAVATGPEAYELLVDKKPDFVFQDFSNVDEIMKAIQSMCR